MTLINNIDIMYVIIVINSVEFITHTSSYIFIAINFIIIGVISLKVVALPGKNM